MYGVGKHMLGKELQFSRVRKGAHGGVVTVRKDKGQGGVFYGAFGVGTARRKVRTNAVAVCRLPH